MSSAPTRTSPAASRGPVDPRLWAHSRSTRRYVYALSVQGSVAALLVVGQAWVLAHALAAVIAGPAWAGAISALPALAGVLVARAVVAGLGPLLAGRAATAVKDELRRELVAARIRQGEAGAEASSLVVTATDGLDGLDGYFTRYLPSLVLAVVVPLTVVVAVLSTDWLSAVIIAVTLPLIPVFMILVGATTQDLTRRRWRVQSRLAHHFADLVAGLPTLQVFGRARAQAEGLRRSEAAHQRETMAVLRLAFTSALVLELLATLSVAVVAVAVGLRLIDGGLSLGVALFVLLLAPEAFLPLRQVGTHFHDSADGVLAAQRAFTVIDSPRIGSRQIEPRQIGPQVFGPGRGVAGRLRTDLRSQPVRVEQVSVGAGERTRLASLSFVLRPGQLVVLTGPSGSGKSTALAVLAGLIAPTSGTVRVGAVELAELDPDDWLAHLGWVGQEPGLVAGTVSDNLALGDPASTRMRRRELLDRVAGADIDLDQPVFAGAEGLSAGQRRRVALARALLRTETGGAEARLLLLDEPTAGLDADAELAALASVRSSGVSAVVVSHRPAVLAAADVVVQVGR